MCVRENTSQAASVEFVRLWYTNYAHSRLQPFAGKTLRVFPTVSMTPAANGRRGHVLFSVPAPPYKLVDRGSPPRRNRSSDRPPYAGKGPQPEDSVCSLRPPPRRSPVSCTRIIVFSFRRKEKGTGHWLGPSCYSLRPIGRRCGSASGCAAPAPASALPAASATASCRTGFPAHWFGVSPPTPDSPAS